MRPGFTKRQSGKGTTKENLPKGRKMEENIEINSLWPIKRMWRPLNPQTLYYTSSSSHLTGKNYDNLRIILLGCSQIGGENIGNYHDLFNSQSILMKGFVNQIQSDIKYLKSLVVGPVSRILTFCSSSDHVGNTVHTAKQFKEFTKN